jgi:hypothetical protein
MGFLIGGMSIYYIDNLRHFLDYLLNPFNNKTVQNEKNILYPRFSNTSYGRNNLHRLPVIDSKAKSCPG